MSRRCADKRRVYLRFAECGLNRRIVVALINAGIDAPERLLSMPPDRILLIQGIGPTLMKEIEQYRAHATSAVSQKAHAKCGQMSDGEPSEGLQ